MAGTPAAFQETLGLTLAEFLAQVEGRLPAAPSEASAEASAATPRGAQGPTGILKSVDLPAEDAAREAARDAALARVAQRG